MPSSETRVAVAGERAVAQKLSRMLLRSFAFSESRLFSATRRWFLRLCRRWKSGGYPVGINCCCRVPRAVALEPDIAKVLPHDHSVNLRRVFP